MIDKNSTPTLNAIQPHLTPTSLMSTVLTTNLYGSCLAGSLDIAQNSLASVQTYIFSASANGFSFLEKRVVSLLYSCLYALCELVLV